MKKIKQIIYYFRLLFHQKKNGSVKSVGSVFLFNKEANLHVSPNVNWPTVTHITDLLPTPVFAYITAEDFRNTKIFYKYNKS